MNGTIVRDAALGDMPGVQAIYAHHVLHGLGTFEEEPPGLDEMRARRDALVEGGFPWLVAVRGVDLLGYAYAGAYRARSAYRFTVEDTLYVAPGMAGRGVGALMLGELIRRCTARGARQMVAVIGDSGNAGSIGVHAKLGFERAGLLRSVGFKHGRWVDVVLMQRPLGPGDGAPIAP